MTIEQRNRPPAGFTSLWGCATALAISGWISGALGGCAAPTATAPSAQEPAEAETPEVVALCCRDGGEGRVTGVDCQPLPPGGTMATCAQDVERKVFVQCSEVVCIAGNCACAAFSDGSLRSLVADVGICCPPGAACQAINAVNPGAYHRACDGDAGPVSGAKHTWCPTPECSFDPATKECACSAPVGSRSAVGQCCYGMTDGATDCQFTALSPAEAATFTCGRAITTNGYDGSVLTGVCQAGCTYSLTRNGASEAYTCSC